MAKEDYLRWVATEMEKAIASFQPHLIFYISGSDPADPTQGECDIIFPNTFFVLGKFPLPNSGSHNATPCARWQRANKPNAALAHWPWWLA
jgi:hypothetical protein